MTRHDETWIIYHSFPSNSCKRTKKTMKKNWRSFDTPLIKISRIVRIARRIAKTWKRLAGANINYGGGRGLLSAISCLVRELWCHFQRGHLVNEKKLVCSKVCGPFANGETFLMDQLGPVSMPCRNGGI